MIGIHKICCMISVPDSSTPITNDLIEWLEKAMQVMNNIQPFSSCKWTFSSEFKPSTDLSMRTWQKRSWFSIKHLINAFTFTITLFKHQASHSKPNEPFQVVDRLAPALLLFFAQPRPRKIFCKFKVLLIQKWKNRHTPLLSSSVEGKDLLCGLKPRLWRL